MLSELTKHKKQNAIFNQKLEFLNKKCFERRRSSLFFFIRDRGGGTVSGMVYIIYYQGFKEVQVH